MCVIPSTRFAWENSKIITTNNRYGQRRCPEAWHINMNQHALNRDDGSYLPQEYLHPCWQMTSPLEYIRSRVVTLDHP